MAVSTSIAAKTAAKVKYLKKLTFEEKIMLPLRLHYRHEQLKNLLADIDYAKIAELAKIAGLEKEWQRILNLKSENR